MGDEPYGGPIRSEDEAKSSGRWPDQRVTGLSVGRNEVLRGTIPSELCGLASASTVRCCGRGHESDVERPHSGVLARRWSLEDTWPGEEASRALSSSMAVYAKLRYSSLT